MIIESFNVLAATARPPNAVTIPAAVVIVNINSPSVTPAFFLALANNTAPSTRPSAAAATNATLSKFLEPVVKTALYFSTILTNPTKPRTIPPAIPRTRIE